MTEAVEQLREAQARAVMPLIGPLIDAWDYMETDEKEQLSAVCPDLAEAIENIREAMAADQQGVARE